MTLMVYYPDKMVKGLRGVYIIFGRCLKMPAAEAPSHSNSLGWVYREFVDHVTLVCDKHHGDGARTIIRLDGTYVAVVLSDSMEGFARGPAVDEEEAVCSANLVLLLLLRHPPIIGTRI